ncbi:astacin-like metalloprotease toxin 5 [Dermatophagoides pteronyssinus]|uniref:astacin-like metalloprotease toxin 5 n=1 Tax=Dermatophagoides pteronyssinus TaxID=6956 RepID=UPI003F676D0C
MHNCQSLSLLLAIIMVNILLNVPKSMFDDDLESININRLYVANNGGGGRFQLSSAIRQSNNNNNKRIGRANNNQQHRRWPNGQIPYQISRKLRPYRSIILQAMKQIEQNTCIRFRQRKSQQNYVKLIAGDGCHSIVGRIGNNGGVQLLSLGNGCHDIGSIIHELCHTIGLYHEHMRYDRDQYLQIQWSNIQPEMLEQFIRIPIQEYKPAYHFDYNSIMIYGSYAFSRNGRPTMLPKNHSIKLRESHFKQSLSSGDIININAMYGCN